MGFARKGILALLAGLGAAVIVGCGSSGSLLSSTQASQLTAQLDSVSQALQDGNCTTAENDISELQSELQSYGGVNSTLLENLNQGVNTIQQLTQNKCSAPTRTTTKTTRTRTTTHSSTNTVTTDTNTSPTTSDTNTDTNTLATTTSTTGGQGLPTDTLPSTTSTTSTTPTGGSGAGTTTTSGATTSTTTPTTTPTATGTTPSTTSTSPAGGATGL